MRSPSPPPGADTDRWMAEEEASEVCARDLHAVDQAPPPPPLSLPFTPAPVPLLLGMLPTLPVE